MYFFSSCALFVALRLLILTVAPTSPVGAVPVPDTQAAAAASSYWVSNIARNGKVAFGDPEYKIYRDVVKDYGAKGDGVTDDTQAINRAISDGNRCGEGCDSSTILPALVYFPPGTYLVSAPIIQYYYTQLVGDAVNPPTLKASAGFTGMAVIDSDPYLPGGANWFTNQNNFFRQVRNFVIDLTAMPMSVGAGIHWQVAQATSLQNIRFEMVRGGGQDNKQQGIFMDNGSGMFFGDLTFNGGGYCAFLGNQQFTSRNLKFDGCQTAIYMNWNWGWTLKNININDCGIGIDMSNSPANQTVGSVILLDSKITNTPVGIKTAYNPSSNVPPTGNTLVIDNVDFTGVQTAVQSYTGGQILAGGSTVQSWVQGNTYTGESGRSNQQEALNPAPSKPSGLMNGNSIFERSKPQYESYSSDSFVSVKANGAKGNGVDDDTAVIQNLVNNLADDKILYFDHGAYRITETVTIPGNKNIKITGEIWPLVMADGPSFSNQDQAKPVFQVGEGNQTGSVEMSDLMFETLGPAPGAIMMQWKSKASSQGSNGLWDVHFRIGGSAGTGLQSDKCKKSPSADHSNPNKDCIGANLLFHTTGSASVYVENAWFWVADHELDLEGHSQIDIYNGRGVLIESTEPVWLYGTSSEHSVLYQYQFNGAKNVFTSFIQTETPYYQKNPVAPVPFEPSGSDPTFSSNEDLAKKAWGLRIVGSSDVLVYGAGLYSFFDNYAQDCLATESCQTNMVQVDKSSNVHLFGLSTKASTNMVVDGSEKPLVVALDNDNNFCQTIAMFATS